MYSDVVHCPEARRFRFLPSVEGVCLFCAIGLALTAIVIPLLPKDVIDWILVHVG
jgi:hypothetical protein